MEETNCTCTKPIGDQPGEVPKGAALALAGSGLFHIEDDQIQYLGGVGSAAKNEAGYWEAPEICPRHAGA